MRPSQRALLAAILTAGFLLRFGGLSHDLDVGAVYHPDTPKQMRTAGRYMHGHFYRHIGLSDYDGYPYFNSLAVAAVSKVGGLVCEGALSLLGVPHGEVRPDTMQLYWITLIFNATLATLSILVLFRIGRANFGLTAAFIGAACLAVSPLDVTACHYATGDTTASFFAALSLLFAFRIYRHGGRGDYVGAAAFAVFGFAAKYHAAAAIVPALVAHVLRAGGWRGLFGAESLKKLALMAVAGIVALFVAIPALFVHPVAMVQDIYGFMTRAMVREPHELRVAGPLARFGIAMERNIPVLVAVLGPLLFITALLSLWDVLRRVPNMLILASLPLVYFFVGVASRPLALPVYHTLITPALFLMAAVVLARLLVAPARTRRVLAPVGLAVIVLSVGYLSVYALKEVFFFRNHDTHRMAKAWARENIPESFVLHKGRYTFTFKPESPAPVGPKGSFSTSSNFDPRHIPSECYPFKSFSVEPDRGLAFFRNPSIDLFMGPSPALRQGFAMPVFQPAPSQAGSPFVFDNGPEFYRTGKLLVLEPGTNFVRRVVARHRLGETWVIVQNGAIPNLVSVSLAGACKRYRMGPGEVAWLAVPKPRKGFPLQQGRFFYRFSARSSYGRARVMIATTAAEKGTMLYNLGCYAEAHPWLCQAAQETKNPTLAAEALVAGAMPGATAAEPDTAGLEEVADRILEVSDAGSLQAVYGIGTAYLDALPYVSLETEEMRRRGFRILGDLAASGEQAAETDFDVPASKRWLESRPLMLNPGCYTVVVRARAVADRLDKCSVRVEVGDARGAVHGEAVLELGPLGKDAYVERRAPIVIPRGVSEVTLVLRPESDAAAAFDKISLAPDPVAGAVALGKEYRVLVRGEKPGVDRKRLVSRSMAEFEAVAGAKGSEPADVLFRHGIRLIGWEVSDVRVKRGDSLGVNLYWSLEEPGVQIGGLVTFLHFVDGSGKTAFQGDDELMEYLPLLPGGGGEEGIFHRVEIPPAAKPGTYRLEFGLYRPDTKKRLKIISSSLEAAGKSVLLPQAIEVTE